MTHSRSQVLFWVCQNWLIYTRCDNISSPLHTTAATTATTTTATSDDNDDSSSNNSSSRAMTVVDRKINTLYDRNGDEQSEVSACVCVSRSLARIRCVCVQRKSSTIYSKVCVHYTYTCHLLAAQLRLVNECLAVTSAIHTHV